MLEQIPCPGSEYILHVHRDRVRFRSSAGDVCQQQDHSGIEHHCIEEVATAAG
jgi:hypothetical protein